MEFKVLKEEDFAEYEQLIAGTGGTMLYHQLNYIRFASQLLEAEFELHGLYEQNKLIAACPWIYKNSSWGKVYNSLAYFGSNGGIVAEKEGYALPMEKSMLAYLQKESASFAYASSVFSDNKLATDDFIVQERLAQVTPLPESAEEESIFAIFHYKTRNMVRKGLKENITFTETDELDFLEQTHVDNMNAVGVTHKKPEFFSLLPEYFEAGKEYEVFEAAIDGEKACAILVFYHKDTVEYYMPAINIVYRNRQPLSALIFHLMKRSAGRGMRMWNWGGTPLSNENLHRFKARFGGEDRPYSYQIKVYNQHLKDLSIEQITESFPGMFVMPFNLLKGAS